jgi:hypothetical protein
VVLGGETPEIIPETNEEHNQRRQQTDLSTNSNANDTGDNSTSERPRHDELFKKVMSEPVAAREFLDHYLPVTFKSKIDLGSVKIEKEIFQKNFYSYAFDFIKRLG